MTTTPITDLIIRIKNGYLAKKETIMSPYSRFREEVLKQLVKFKYIKSYQVTGEKLKKITIELLYNDGIPAVSDVKIFSKPGRRYYVSYRQLKPVLGGYGISILSTPKGVLSNKEAYKLKIGGELLFNIW